MQPHFLFNFNWLKHPFLGVDRGPPNKIIHRVQKNSACYYGVGLSEIRIFSNCVQFVNDWRDILEESESLNKSIYNFIK